MCDLRVSLLSLILSSTLFAADWQPVGDRIKTKWAKEVTPEKVLPEYPRPQLVRKEWQNLNGLWDYAIRPRAEKSADAFDGKILVPFCIESSLSGVGKNVGADNRLWYRRTFQSPDLAGGKRLLLHFGAVDWETTVFVNGKPVGEHRGGYDPFSFDITDALVDGKEQQLTVAVWDPTDQSYQPRGKQVREPQGIWYTSVTGIWQTVWLEPVPAVSISKLIVATDIDEGKVSVSVATNRRKADVQVEATVLDGTKTLDSKTGDLIFSIPNAKLWSPESPFLYGLTVSLKRGDEVLDTVTSYFGMRKIHIAKDQDGFNRLFLNNKPLFMVGPLDQGWWPDGLYTAPTDAALLYDIEVTKDLGFNMARKHVKVEPARWYYHCDRLGLLVWQDFPSGDKYIRDREPDFDRGDESTENFYRELGRMMDALVNHPCIVVWVPFNEGWGQFDTDKVLAWVKEKDPTRLVDGPSGWTDRGTGDMNDMHRYPGPGMPPVEEKRAVVLGEFGGLGLPMQKHLWWDKRNWGYRTYQSREELNRHYARLLRALRPLAAKGLAAAVYTQTTDVEGEVNGLMTYDREVVKFDAAELRNLHDRLQLPLPQTESKVVIPTSQAEPQTWKYTTEQPKDGWFAADFDDSSWKEGPGGFGEPSTPGSKVRTSWKTKDIWLRRTFDFDGKAPANGHIRIHHDEDSQVYLNGTLVAETTGYVVEYTDVEPADRLVLRAGPNTIAVHCRQTGGGQYIDVGIVDIVEKNR